MNKYEEEIRKYYIQVQPQINEMSDGDMKSHLVSLEGTPIWFAILKYTQSRVGQIQNSFLTLDPVKEPSRISNYQGVITGVLDIEDAVLNLKFKAEEAARPKKKGEVDKNELGGAYGKV